MAAPRRPGSAPWPRSRAWATDPEWAAGPARTGAPTKTVGAPDSPSVDPGGRPASPRSSKPALRQRQVSHYLLIWFSGQRPTVSIMNKFRTLAIFTGLVALLVAGCSSPGAQSPGPTIGPVGPSSQPDTNASFTRTSKGGQVTITVMWAGPTSAVSFDVALDTHSVDLDGLDLTNAILRNDRGETMSAGPWSAPKGGHHREGTLTFNGDSALFLERSHWIELEFSGIGDGPARTLRWDLGS